MKRIFGCLLLIAPSFLRAQTYNVSLIPDSLKKDARAVLRDEEIVLEIKSPGKAVIKERHAYTILNEKGDNLGGYASFYNKFISINSISGILYDMTGKELKKVKKKDMEDRSGVGEYNLIDDTRYKEHDFYCHNYPYTVEYQEEDEQDGVLYFDNWNPLKSSGVSTQHSKYIIIAPRNYTVRYKPLNCNITPVITESGDKKIYTWETGNLPARSTEVRGPRWREIAPSVLFAPSEFEAQGFKGNMTTWEDYGKFINQLRTGRDVLPENIKKKVHELTDSLKDPRQKVYALYDFLQKNTHYISVQLGIGGWQPFPADYVAARRYGDCKALSNYMVALLKEAGIAGKYVEIRAGSDAPAMIEDFPSFQSNHVISCVPMGKDTIWLECTSQTESPGYMGSFTGGRKAILIDEDGGHVVSTPVYSSKENTRTRTVNAEISPEGNLDAEVNTVYTGILQELPHGLMNELTGEEREKYLNNLLHLPTYKVEKSQYEELRGTIPAIKEYLHIVSPNYAGISGKRLFITPDLFDKSAIRLPADSARKYDFIFDRAYKSSDSIIIKIPPGYRAESVPSDVSINNKFGQYSASMKVMADKIVYYRSREEPIRRFPPSDYGEMVRFYERMYKSDHSRIVLVKQE
jgi:uncharacterized protein DUF3857/transglutaminase superfamily protein